MADQEKDLTILAQEKRIRIENSEVNIYTGDGGPLLKEVLSIVQKLRAAQKQQQIDITEIKVALQALINESGLSEKIARIRAQVESSDQKITDEMKPDHNPPLSTDKK